jgi:hypothetical protein
MGSGNLIAGAILVAVGAVLSLTGIGFFIGVPLAFLGLAVMFPNLAQALIILAIAGGAFLYLAF